jgi:Flp pilus assembly protein TadD
MSFALAAICASIAIALALASGDASRLRKAEDAGGRGDYVAALADAKAVHGEPGRTRAYAVRAYASLGLGDALNSLRWFRLAIRSDPSDWQLRRDKALPLFLLGRLKAAQAELAAAKRLNPLLRIPARPQG